MGGGAIYRKYLVDTNIGVNVDIRCWGSLNGDGEKKRDEKEWEERVKLHIGLFCFCSCRDAFLLVRTGGDRKGE